jgi:hypothetical protein
MSPVKFKITDDTVACHFSLLYCWLEEDARKTVYQAKTWISNAKSVHNIFVCPNAYCERWLLILFILMELLTITY